MTKSELVKRIKEKKSFLCVGLDADIHKIPKHLLKEEDPLFEFNKQIIDSTLPYAVAYKPNIAFYEAHGIAGWNALKKTLEYLPEDVFTIADAKRGDIGNTSKMYARAFFESFNFDSITVAPYMGSDSVTPFLEFENKWAIILGATSNEGGNDFQNLETKNGDKIYETVIKKSAKWGNDKNLMYVVGATKPQALQSIRKIIPNHFLLIPGVGAQGGSLEEVCKYGLNEEYGLLINSSRGIIYADNSENFAEKAGKAAQKIVVQMERYF